MEVAEVIDIETPTETGTEIRLPDKDTLIDAFAKKTVKSVVELIETDVRKIVYDIDKPAERKAARSLAAKIARSKTTIDEFGKKLTEDARAKIASVNEERNIAKERLAALKADVLAPVEKWEAKDEARKQMHRDRLATFHLDRVTFNDSSEAIQAVIDEITSNVVDETWEEFQKTAAEAQAEALEHYTKLIENVRVQEDQQAEIERLKAERAKEAEQAAEQERQRIKEQEEALAAEREKTAKLEAEAAERQAQAEAVTKQQEAATSFTELASKFNADLEDDEADLDGLHKSLIKMNEILADTGPNRQGLQVLFDVMEKAFNSRLDAKRIEDQEKERQRKAADDAEQERLNREAAERDEAEKNKVEAANAERRLELIAKISAQIEPLTLQEIAVLIADDKIEGVSITHL